MSKTIYCTIAAANYLPRVQILRDSLRNAGHHEFVLLLIEHPKVVARLRAELPDYQIVGPDELGCPQWLHMAFYYDVMEFSTALKPALIALLMDRGNVVYLDPDIEVFSPLTEIEELLDHNSIVVTPHVTQPLPNDGKYPAMNQVLLRGQFNLGFIGVRATPENRALMAWWQSVLIEGGTADARTSTFTDQFWAAALVSFAQTTCILRSARYNMAYWNVAQRQLSWDGQGSPQTEDGPLGFYHYSGLNESVLTQVSKYQDRIRTEPGTPLYRILEQYLKQIAQSPIGHLASLPYSFAAYTDATPILKEHRRAFLLLAAVNRMANPFAQPAAIGQLRGTSPPPFSGDLDQALTDAQWRIHELEQRLSSLPYSLVNHVAFAMNRVAPGSAERLQKVMQQASHRFGPQMDKLRQRLS